MKRSLIAAVVALAAVFPLASAGPALAGPDVGAVAASAPRSAPWWQDAVDDPQLKGLLGRVDALSLSLEEMNQWLKKGEFPGSAESISEGRAAIQAAVLEGYSVCRHSPELLRLAQDERERAAADAFHARTYLSAGRIDAEGVVELETWNEVMQKTTAHFGRFQSFCAEKKALIDALVARDGGGDGWVGTPPLEFAVRWPDLERIPLSVVRGRERVAVAERELLRILAAEPGPKPDLEAVWANLTLRDLFHTLYQGDKDRSPSRAEIEAELRHPKEFVPRASKAQEVSAILVTRLALPKSPSPALQEAVNGYRSAVAQALDEIESRVDSAREAAANVEKAREKEAIAIDRLNQAVFASFRSQVRPIENSRAVREFAFARLKVRADLYRRESCVGSLLAHLYRH